MLTAYDSAGMTTPLLDLVAWFQAQTAATVEGNELGSETLVFRPMQRANSKTLNTVIAKGNSKNKYVPTFNLTHKETKFETKDVGSSAIATLQTILPHLLMIGNHSGHNTPREILIKGATNCPGTPSFEYLKQVFEPALKQYFGIEINCELIRRGWAQQPISKGEIKVALTPLALDTTIIPEKAAQLGIAEEGHQSEDLVDIDIDIRKVTATIVAPITTHKLLQDIIHDAIETEFFIEDLDITIDMQDSKVDHKTRADDHVYILLVAQSDSCRWGMDWISSKSSNIWHEDLEDDVRDKTEVTLEKEDDKKQITELCRTLYNDITGENECLVDHFLQDQLVIYQALAKGKSSFQKQKLGVVDPRCVQRARATASRMLGACFAGCVCTGAGVKVGEHVKVDVEKKQQLEGRLPTKREEQEKMRLEKLQQKKKQT